MQKKWTPSSWQNKPGKHMPTYKDRASLLSVLDDLERLSKASDENGENNSDKIKEGIELIKNKINKRFADMEVTSFSEPGEIADPELHDALMMRSEKGKKENEILEVFEKGYRYKDRVIRHAKVVVNQAS